MKKILFSIMMLFAFVCNINAQEFVPVFNKQNVSLFLNGGVQTNLHDWNAPQGAVVNLGVNYQFTPIFGLTAEVGTGINNTRNWYAGSRHFHGTDFDQISAFIDARVNLMNAFGGYTGNARVFEIEPLVGIGMGHAFNKHVTYNNVVLGKAGINFNFNINNHWAINVTPAVIWNLRGDIKHVMNAEYAVAQLTAGVTYSFPSYYAGVTECLMYSQHDIDVLNDEINILRASNAAAVAEVREVIKEVVRVDTVYANIPESTGTVAFTVNSFKVPAYVPVLDALVKQFDVNSTDMYVVEGYASVEGAESFNDKLAERRANAVKQYLVNAGIPENRIKAEGKGETVTYGDALMYNRVVVVKYGK